MCCVQSGQISEGDKNPDPLITVSYDVHTIIIQHLVVRGGPRTTHPPTKNTHPQTLANYEQCVYTYKHLFLYSSVYPTWELANQLGSPTVGVPAWPLMDDVHLLSSVIPINSQPPPPFTQIGILNSIIQPILYSGALIL